ELLETWTRGRSKNEAAEALLAANVPCAPVRNLREVMNDPNMLARGSLQTVDHPDLGRVNLPHSALTFPALPRRPIEPSLPLGSRNAAVFGDWLGRPAEELARLKADGVI